MRQVSKTMVCSIDRVVVAEGYGAFAEHTAERIICAIDLNIEQADGIRLLKARELADNIGFHYPPRP